MVKFGENLLLFLATVASYQLGVILTSHKWGILLNENVLGDGYVSRVYRSIRFLHNFNGLGLIK